ncbi:MAG: hypothetical protein U0Y82_16740, partial [Thermoleophilia bacterium]
CAPQLLQNAPMHRAHMVNMQRDERERLGTMRITERAIGADELVVWATDDATGLRAALAMPRAATRPCLAALTLAPHADSTEAVRDALRRAHRMDHGLRLLGISAAGASLVVMAPEDHPRRADLCDALGHFLARLGRDVAVMPGPGTGHADLMAVAAAWPRVAGASPADHHLPPEARGAVAAARTAHQHLTGAGLGRARGEVLGPDRPGTGVARMLAAHDARVYVADPDARCAAVLADEVGGQAVPMDAALRSDCEILMPCLPGLRLTAADAEGLGCRILVGPADDQLEGPEVATALAARGILWLPEALAGAGSILAASGELHLPGAVRDVDSDTARVVELTQTMLTASDRTGVHLSELVARDGGIPPDGDTPPSRVRAIRAA